MTESSTSEPRPRRLRRFRPDPSAFPGFTLTDRDIDIIRAVSEYRFLLADHIRSLIPGSAQGITRRLQALYHTNHLDRLQPPLRVKRLGPHELRPPMVYVLRRKGKEALLGSGMSDQDIPWRPEWNLRGAHHLEHELMLSNFRVTLELALADHPTIEMTGWLPDEELRDTVTVEKPNGRVRVIEYRVSPDGYAAVRAAGSHINLLVEADNGNEEMGRIAYKARAYWFYLTPHASYWTKYESPERRLVLFVTTSERRLTNMMKTLASVEEFRGRGLRQFWFCSEDDFSVRQPASLLGPIWRTFGQIQTNPAGAVTRYSVERKALFSDQPNKEA